MMISEFLVAALHININMCAEVKMQGTRVRRKQQPKLVSRTHGNCAYTRACGMQVGFLLQGHAP